MKLAATTRIIAACLLSASASSISNAQVPGAIVVAGEVALLAVHAEGAQIYECKANSAAQLVWQFREPIAALIIDGKTVGRHYAGPTWEMSDGSAITGKEVARASGATAKDIPLLKLEVTSRLVGRANSRASRRSSERTPEAARLKAPATRAALS